MKKHYLLSVLLASFLLLISFYSVDAQGSRSISGDDLCGSSASTICGVKDIKSIGQSLAYAFVLIGGSALVLLIAIRLVQAWFAYRAGNANAINDSGKKIWNGLVGFFMFIVIIGGFLMAALSYLGTKPEFLKILQLFAGFFVEHAYAANDGLLPNPTTFNNLFDLILAALALAMRFFIYPSLIVMWVWSGFQYVYAQGNPEGLKKAHSWLFWAFLITAITFMLQTFLFALKATALKIAPQNAALIQPKP